MLLFSCSGCKVHYSSSDSLPGRGDVGLVSDDANMKRYVKNWYTIFDTFELTNSFMLEKLQMERDVIEKKSREELVKELQEESVDV